MGLRPYQIKAKNDTYAAWQAGHRNVLMVQPTGGGKTRTFSEIISEFDGPSVAIAHRQELVSQISLALGGYGVRHNIIAPEKTIRNIETLHMQKLGRRWVDRRAHTNVAGVDTLIRMDPDDAMFKRTGLWVTDECFPAGTMIDTPAGEIAIDELKVGDVVTAFNEHSFTFENKRVLHVFVNPMPKSMMRIKSAHHVLYCTKNHPVLTKSGWVSAENITSGSEIYVDDLRLVQERSDRSDSCRKVSETKNRSYLLFTRMFDCVSRFGFFGNRKKNELEVCFGTNEVAKSDGERRLSKENVGDFAGNQTQTSGPRWKWQADVCSRVAVGLHAWWLRFRDAVSNKDRLETWFRRRLSSGIQAGCCASSVQNSDRGGRAESLLPVEKSAGCEKGRMFVWSRVDSVAILEQDDIGVTGGSNGDRNVYNIEVEDCHTYVADGVVVHNCHHVLGKNKWGKAVEMFPNAYGLGVTATPIRADGCGLGSHADGVFDTMVRGPSPRDLINAGYLVPYRYFAPESDLDLSNVDVGESGEYVTKQLRDAVHKSHITGDIVANYLNVVPGKKAIVFAVDVEHATEISKSFRDAGVRSEVVSGKTPDILRAEIMRRFEASELDVLVNVDLFGEGVDVPAVEVVIMGRPTQSFSLYCQQAGRSLRLLISLVLMGVWDTYTPEQRRRFIADSEKPVAYIFDHVKNWERHGLFDVERAYSLDRRERRTRNSMPDSIPTRTCTNVPESTGVICMNVYERTEKYCPACGCKPEPAARSAPEFVDGDLYELDLNALRFLRGEADKIMGAPAIPHGATDIIAQAIRNRHKEKQSAQVTLRELMAQWGGVQVHKGHNDPSYQQRLFYLTFGIDVLSAQALPRKEAEDLTDKIIKRIAIDMTVNKDQTAV